MADFNSLPDVIKPFVDKIKSTKKSLVEMTLTPVEDYILWDSRVGGMPYLPINEKYPTNSAGTPLKLLAQINFTQMPKLENYPEKGILQFFIGGDDLYGADFEQRQKQEDFRIIYWKDIIEDASQLTQDFSAVIAAHSDDYYGWSAAGSALGACSGLPAPFWPLSAATSVGRSVGARAWRTPFTYLWPSVPPNSLASSMLSLSTTRQGTSGQCRNS